MKITANIVPSITGTIQRQPVASEPKERLKKLIEGFHLADTIPHEKESDTVKVLIGSDYYLDVIPPDRLKVQSGLYMLNSRLGWILTGRQTNMTVNQCIPVCSFLHMEKTSIIQLYSLVWKVLCQ